MRLEKIIKYKKRKTFNIGLIIYGVIFIYIIISVITFFNRKKVPIYEVESGTIKESDIFEGLILREEKIIESSYKGFVNYYFREGDKAAKNSVICTISNSESIKTNNEYKLSKDQLSILSTQISNYAINNNDHFFDSIYDLKYNLNNKLLEFQQIYQNEILNIDELEEQQSDINLVESKSSGIISYEIDGYENKNINNISSDDFDVDLEKKHLFSQNKVEEGNALYKIINGHSWNVIIPTSEKFNENININDKIHIKDINNNNTLLAEVIDIITLNEEEFAILKINQYLTDYINERHIELEIIYFEIEGIKIPNSSIVEKSFLKIPKDLATRSGGDLGVLKTVYTEEGEESVKFIPFDIYRDEGDYYYFSGNLELKDIIVKAGSNEKYQINEDVILQGVYDANKGYARFKLIEKLYSNDLYSIIKYNIPYGLNLYDHIIIDGEKIKEDEIIH